MEPDAHRGAGTWQGPSVAQFTRVGTQQALTPGSQAGPGRAGLGSWSRGHQGPLGFWKPVFLGQATFVFREPSCALGNSRSCFVHQAICPVVHCPFQRNPECHHILRAHSITALTLSKTFLCGSTDSVLGPALCRFTEPPVTFHGSPGFMDADPEGGMQRSSPLPKAMHLERGPYHALTAHEGRRGPMGSGRTGLGYSAGPLGSIQKGADSPLSQVADRTHGGGSLSSFPVSPSLPPSHPPPGCVLKHARNISLALLFI